MYLLIKHSHQIIAVITLLVFVILSILMFMHSPAVNHKLLKISPHLLYALLLASGIALAVQLSFRLGDHPWLQAKLAFLIAFIVTALFTFKIKSMATRKLLFALSIIIFINILVIAFTKSAAGIFALI